MQKGLGQHALTSTPCPNFGQLTVIIISQFLYKKINFATFVNERPVLKLFQLAHCNFFISQHAYSMYKLSDQCLILIFRSQGMLSYMKYLNLSEVRQVRGAEDVYTPPRKTLLLYQGAGSRITPDLFLRGSGSDSSTFCQAPPAPEVFQAARLQCLI